MTIHDPLTTDAVLAAFDEHLRRTRGVCPEVRHTYTRFVRAFLEEVFEGGPVDPARICVRDIAETNSTMSRTQMRAGSTGPPSKTSSKNARTNLV